jgi:glycosyltransferase involved in cell wall biosynthesis
VEPVRRILYVEINEDGTVGGSYRSLFNLATHLDRRRFDPRVIFYQANPFAPLLRKRGIPAEVWEATRQRERQALRAGGRAGKLAGLARAIARRAALLRRERIDLLHLNNHPGINYDDWLPAARLARIPCVTHARGILPVPRQALARWLTRRFDRVIAISRYIEDEMRRFGVPERALRIVYNGVDLEAITARATRPPAETRAELGLAAGDRLLVKVAHLRRWKGQDVLVEAVARMPEAARARTHVAFLGATSDDEREFAASLERRARELGLAERLHFLGQRDDAPDWLRAADVVVHTARDPEPFGLVIVEALCLGRPVVAPEAGGPAEILDETCGRSLPPEDAAALAACLTQLVQDDALREKLAAGARARAERFGIARTVREIEAIYAELLA